MCLPSTLQRYTVRVNPSPPPAERYGSAVTAFAARPFDAPHRRECRAVIYMASFLSYGRYPRNIGTRVEVILHMVLKFQINRACFQGGATFVPWFRHRIALPDLYLLRKDAPC